MKKKLCIFFLALFICSLAGCKNSDLFNMEYPERKSFPKALISRNDGEIELITYEELWNMYNNDKKLFKSVYGGAEIYFVANLNRTYKKNTKINDEDLDLITFREGWVVFLLSDTYVMPVLTYNSYLFVRTNIYVRDDGFDFRGTTANNELTIDSLLTSVFERVDCNTEEEMIGTLNYNYQVHQLTKSLNNILKIVESFDYKTYNKNLKKTTTIKNKIKELQAEISYIEDEIEYELFDEDSINQIRNITNKAQSIINDINNKKKTSNKDIPSMLKLFKKRFAYKVTDDNIKTIE